MNAQTAKYASFAKRPDATRQVENPVHRGPTMMTKHLKADISLAERRRIEREQWAEIRAMLAPRHFAAMHEQMAIDAALARLELEALLDAAPAINAIMAGKGQGAVPVAAPVSPEPDAPALAPLPVPDMPYDLRYHLGLR